MSPLTGWPARLGLLTAACLLLLLVGRGAALTGSSAAGRLAGTLLRERFTAGRMAGQKAWEPCALVDGDSLVPRTSCGRPPRDGTRRSGRIDAAARAARRELRSDSSAATLRAGALLYLRSGTATPSHLDRAVESLERARRLAPDDPAVLNDLAVAYLELGERDQQLAPMLRALDAIERAFTRDSAHPSVLFNRALVLQRLYLVKSAERAWARYLAVERHPRWRAEAEAHARRVAQVADTVSWDSLLESPPGRIDAPTRADVAARVRRSPQAAREFSFRLLGEWGSAVERGDGARAARLLALAREIGAAADALGADRSAALAVRAIDSLPGDAGRLQALAGAHAELARGQRLFSDNRFGAAVPTLGHAERTLRSAGSPAARWAAFYRGASELNRVEYATGDSILGRLASEARPDEPALAGKTIWALGLSQLRRGNYDDAIRRYREAAPYVASAREAENEGAIALLLGEGLALAGQSGAGLAEAYRGLHVLSRFRRSTFLNNHLAIVAAHARGSGLSHAALAVTGELVEVARAIDRPHLRALASCARARDLAAVGRRSAARAELAESRRWAARIPPGPGGDRIRAHVNLALGQLERTRDPRAALPMLAEAVESYRGFEQELYLATALHEAALAAWGSGDPARARRWLRQAIEHVERQQASFQSAESRATFYETVENVFDAMIGIELEGARPGAAFEYLERGRIAAVPPDERRASSAGRVGLAGIAASLPEDMLFVEYALLHDQLVIWTASRRGARRYRVPVPRDSVASLVDLFTAETSGARAGATDAPARLFDFLVRPLARELEGIRQLTVVPDRELYRVPFAALRDGGTGRYLVEGYRLRTVPSAAFFLAASAGPRPAGAGATALVVGDPALGASPALPLAPLPGAAREAETVAGLYPGAELLTGPEAHRGRVLDLLPGPSIFHFAGHAVFNSEQPALSYLALAPDGPGDAGILRAREIGELRLSNLEVVVLSACSSLSPRASRTGAIAGLAYSFLRAGAPATVSTLWDVDDDATTELLVRFHRRLAAGTPAAEALRLSQVDALKSGRPEMRDPRAWAAFVYTGP